MEENKTPTVTEEVSAPAEFSNPEVRVLVHRKPACRVELEVEASPSLVKAAHRKAVKLISKEVVLPGFRKGKAPEEMVEKKYPHEIEKQLKENLAVLAFEECQKLINLPTLNNERKISFNTQSHSLKEGAKLILFFEAEPLIPSIDPKELVLKTIERPAVNQEKVDETIRQIQFFFAKWDHVEDRPVQEGDFVILNVDVIEEDPPKNVFSGVRFEVTDKSMAKWMKDLVLGQNKGAALEGISAPDENATEREKEELSAKQVRVTIADIATAALPELDDAFARRMGSESIDVMKAAIEKLLNKQADEHVQEKMREQVSDALLLKYPFDIPHSLIDRETRFRMNQLLQDPEYQTHWKSMTGEARKRTVSSIAEQSEKAVRMFYLCRKILADAHIKVSPADLPKPSDNPLEYLLGTRRDFNPQENSELHQAEAFSRLLLEKAEDHLISHATIE